MSASLRRIARRIRHLPMLHRYNLLWSLLRAPYRALLDVRGLGVQLKIGGVADARIPAAFIGGSWEEYESEEMAQMLAWVRQHPDGLILDVGSSAGIFSVAALFASNKNHVIAFDPDLASLAAARHMCRYAPGHRLQLVHGFLADTSLVPKSISEAIEETRQTLAPVSSKDVRTRYICLCDPDIESVPRFAVDDLFASELMQSRSDVLIKCDVEGAEMSVLKGAHKFLSKHHPNLLLSVHPPMLATYKTSCEEIRRYLLGLGYSITLLATDHEEHWWCY